MRKQIVEYTSPLDALVAIAKQLNIYEIKYQMDSEEFFAKYTQGETSDDEDFIELSGNYQHYLAIHHDLESKLKNVA
ncbi:MAG: hypothetical protein WCQ26_09470 [Pseudanabaena sp. ELA748]